jgi:hypothetical protein
MRPIFSVNNPGPGPLYRRTITAAFPQRIMPAGTVRGASTAGTVHPFDRSMAAQAARVPRLANIQVSGLAPNKTPKAVAVGRRFTPFF